MKERGLIGSHDFSHTHRHLLLQSDAFWLKKNTRATYQRAMQTIFEDMLHKTVECYVDDLVVK